MDLPDELQSIIGRLSSKAITLPEDDIKCDSRDCPVFYTRIKETSAFESMKERVDGVVEILEEQDDEEDSAEPSDQEESEEQDDLQTKERQIQDVEVTFGVIRIQEGRNNIMSRWNSKNCAN